MSTPSTDRIRSLYANATAWDMGEREDRPDLQHMRDTQYAEFDAWLAQHDREIQAQALEEAADRLHVRTDGVNREGTKGWPERHRQVYAHAIDEASDALREDAVRLAATTGEPTT